MLPTRFGLLLIEPVPLVLLIMSIFLVMRISLIFSIMLVLCAIGAIKQMTSRVNFETGAVTNERIFFAKVGLLLLLRP